MRRIRPTPVGPNLLSLAGVRGTEQSPGAPRSRPKLVAKRSVVLLVLTALAVGGASVPAGAESGRAERFSGSLVLRATSDQPVWSTVAADGAFDDTGTIHFVDDANGVHHDVFVFSGGTAELAEVAKTDTFSFDPSTCVGSDRESGSYQLSGTGRYAGLTGHGTWHHEATIVAPFGPGCSPADPQTVGFVKFTATGPAIVGDEG
jgi:hypothetical protein